MSTNLDLKIHGIESSWADLSRWLVPGGAATKSNDFFNSLTEETFENLCDQRAKFIKEVYENAIAFDSAKGARPMTTRASISRFNGFVRWIDNQGSKLSCNSKVLEQHFRAYDQWWYERAWIAKTVAYETAYNTVNEVARILTLTFELPEYLSFRNKSKVVKKYKHPRKVSVSPKGEKQHLGNSKRLGQYCVELADAITIEAVYGCLPIRSEVTSENENSAFLTAIPSGLVSMLNHKTPRTRALAKGLCRPVQQDVELNSYRAGIVKLRLIAEFLIFIFQTGMNVSQVLELKRRYFKYKLKGDFEWSVSTHKPRRQGGVEFTIYKSYKPWFKRYLEFIDHFFPNDERLFPLGNQKMSDQGAIKYETFKNQLGQDSIPWIPPSIIRNTRINFIDRISSDPNVSTEMAQHARETFKERYQLPSQQRSLTAITDFWKNEPMSLLNSGCNGKPEVIDSKTDVAVAPDCMHESGCLFCKNHRDINSFDYVWGLITFRWLKIVELQLLDKVTADNPANLVVAKLTDKIKAYEELGLESRGWVIESLERIEEGDYHPNWNNILRFWEGENA